MMSEQDDGLQIQKMDYLQGKYVFRYPYTFTSIKWGMVIGGFFGLHTYIKTRNIRHSFFNWVERTVLFTFLVWAYFYAKYNFYQNSINEHEYEEEQKNRQAVFLKKYLQYKLRIPDNVSLSEAQLLQQYEKYAKRQLERGSKLQIMLSDITSTTFDMPLTQNK